jgi:uncharacterized membrane protein
MSARSRTVSGVFGAVAAFYPILVWQGLARLGVQAVGFLALAGIALSVPLRVRAGRVAIFQALGLAVIVALLVLGSMWVGDRRFLLAMPSIVNVMLLLTFGASLRLGSTPMIERFARMTYDTLTPERLTHCRQATIAWTAFFALNAIACGWVALFGSLATWGIYTGCVSYVLVALMFGAEYAVRRIRFG